MGALIKKVETGKFFNELGECLHVLQNADNAQIVAKWETQEGFFNLFIFFDKDEESFMHTYQEHFKEGVVSCVDYEIISDLDTQDLADCILSDLEGFGIDIEKYKFIIVEEI